MIVSKSTPFFLAALTEAVRVLWAEKIAVSIPACESTVYAQLQIVSVDTSLYGFWKLNYE